MYYPSAVVLLTDRPEQAWELNYGATSLLNAKDKCGISARCHSNTPFPYHKNAELEAAVLGQYTLWPVAEVVFWFGKDLDFRLSGHDRGANDDGMGI